MTERREFTAVFLAVSAVLIVMWAFLPHDTFFAGDSAVKLLQVENLLANKYSSATLRYNGHDLDPDSVISPFLIGSSVYVKDGENYSVFPVLFPFLCSLLFAAFGYVGLYVLPLASAMLCIALSYAIARRFVPPRIALLAAAASVLATPVFFYSQTFWEHVPCVAIFLAAIWLLLRCGESSVQAALSGLLLGTGVWLRSEMLILAALLFFFGFCFLRRSKTLWTSVAAMAVPLAILLVFNKNVYGEWLGHVSHNLAWFSAGSDGSLSSIAKLRAEWLWTSLLGLNAPQVLPAEIAGWEKSLRVIRANRVLELLAFGAVGGMAISSVIGARLAGRVDESRSGGQIVRISLFPTIQLTLLVLLAAVVAWYATTFLQDRSPLITVLKSGGLFTFSPFLAAVLCTPLLRIDARPWGREFSWLLYTCLAFAVIMPVLAPNPGAIRYGARYLLPATALLAVLAVVVFHTLCAGRIRRVGFAILSVLLALSLVVEARGWQLLFHKKTFSRDFTATLMASPADRIATTGFWIPFEVPRVLLDRKVHGIGLTERSIDFLLTHSLRAGDKSIDVVVVGRTEDFPEIPGAVVIDRAEVVQDFDTYFNVTVFRLAVW